MKDFEAKSWYSEVAATFKSGYLALSTLEQRKNWYSEVADAYNKARPRYPQELISRTVELTQLPSDASILEVGCGPGTATTAFARFGFSMVCLDPSQEACQLARQNSALYPDVEIINTTFEEWELETKRFNAVLAANSFHWVSPEIGYQKAAAVLQDNGSLILLWNMTPQPRYEIYQMLEEIYQIQAPSLVRYEQERTQEETLKKFGQNIMNSGTFKDLVSEQLACKVTYNIDNYLALLSTLSPYISLEPQQRNSLFEALREVLERNCSKGIQTSYLSAFHIAKKI